jgi:hypothetical protein
MGTCKSKPYMATTAFVQAGIYFPTYINIAVDIIFSLIPIPMLLQTTLDRKQKITVSVYLALSTIGSVCAVGKIFYTYHNTGTFQGIISVARGYSSFNTGELAAYIIGGCIAAYRPMLMALGRRINTTILSTYQTRAHATHGSSFLERSRNRRSGVGSLAVHAANELAREGKDNPKSPTFSMEKEPVSPAGPAGMAIPYGPGDVEEGHFRECVKEHSVVESSDTKSESGLRHEKSESGLGHEKSESS